MKDYRDYRTLYWTPDMDGPWSEAAEDKYVTGGHDSVLYRVPEGVTHPTLEFVTRLPNLRCLSVHGRVQDDSAVNTVESLEYLSLLTGAKAPLAVDRLRDLHFLAADGPRDLTAVRGLTELRSLVIAGCRYPDLSFLGAKPSLTRLRLDGRPSRLALDGIEGCPSLRVLELRDHRVPSLAPLRTLTALERLTISGPRRFTADNDLDFEDLADLQHLEVLRLTAAGVVRSLAPLRRLSRLRDLCLQGTTVADGKPVDLPRWVKVTGLGLAGSQL